MLHSTTNALSRRGLVLLGTAGLAALSPLLSTASKKKRKNKRRQLNANALCKKQVDQCLDFFAPICEDDLECQALIETCCPETGQCDFTGFIVCLDNAGGTVELAGPLFTKP